MIRYDHVYKEFGKHSFALRDITVQIDDGEFVFVIGPSGAGKTTILRLLLRDILPTKGNIFVDDWEVGSLHPSKIFLLRRKIGMVFQDYKLLTDRTVFENVAIGLEILGKNTGDVKKAVDNILDLVGLSDKAHLFPLQLSAGEMQRTSVARAIIAGPKILLADEPTGNLDPKTAWGILDILKEVNRIGTTVIMATHNVSIVNELKKRTINLEHGKIISDEAKGKYHVYDRQKHDDVIHTEKTSPEADHGKEKKTHGNP